VVAGCPRPQAIIVGYLEHAGSNCRATGVIEPAGCQQAGLALAGWVAGACRVARLVADGLHAAVRTGPAGGVQIVALTGVDRVIPVYPSLEDALM
jgi:hypothetical protein